MRARMLRPVVTFAASLLALTATAAEIFRCTDASGNVTYQNEPCPKNMKAGRVDIFDNSWTADRAEKEAEWRRSAAAHQVATGMPQRWVREAFGEPAEIRATATAGAAEVWVYNFPDRSVQVGMLGEQVLWFRETPIVAPVTRVAPGAVQSAPVAAPPTRVAPAEQPAPVAAPVTRVAPGADQPALDHAGAEPPRTGAEPPPPRVESPPALAKAADPVRVLRGQDCKQALAALGQPDRQREVPPIDSASDPVTEYIYEPAASAGVVRTRLVCANGKVEGIDRSVAR
jgi:hypothetical protein